eukprot:gene1513-biopygen10850
MGPLPRRVPARVWPARGAPRGAGTFGAAGRGGAGKRAGPRPRGGFGARVGGSGPQATRHGCAGVTATQRCVRVGRKGRRMVVGADRRGGGGAGAHHHHRHRPATPCTLGNGHGHAQCTSCTAGMEEMGAPRARTGRALDHFSLRRGDCPPGRCGRAPGEGAVGSLCLRGGRALADGRNLRGAGRLPVLLEQLVALRDAPLVRAGLGCAERPPTGGLQALPGRDGSERAPHARRAPEFEESGRVLGACRAGASVASPSTRASPARAPTAWCAAAARRPTCRASRSPSAAARRAPRAAPPRRRGRAVHVPARAQPRLEAERELRKVDEPLLLRVRGVVPKRLREQVRLQPLLVQRGLHHAQRAQ